jgi:hypothetical protein
MSNRYSGLPFVSIYPQGKVKEKGRLTDSNLVSPQAIGVDSSGNVYVASFSSSAMIIEFKGGRMPGTQLEMRALGQPAGTLLFDKVDNMIIPDRLNSRVNIYAPPYTGSPTSIALKDGGPNRCSLNHDETILGCAETTGYYLYTFNFYSYPGGKYKYSIVPQYPYIGYDGIAFSPEGSR